jgi:hypothetical protein
MPIQFPPQDLRGPDWDWAGNLQTAEVTYDTTDLGGIGRAFENQDCFAPGLPIGFDGSAPRAVNLRNPGFDYESPEWFQRVNPAIQGPVPALSPTVQDYGQVDQSRSSFSYDYVRQQISGITRDSTGAVLGSCEVRVFRTEDNLFIGSTTSDPTTGAWSLQIWAGGPFFFVEYKTGSPDKAGASLRTLVAQTY